MTRYGDCHRKAARRHGPARSGRTLFNPLRESSPARRSWLCKHVQDNFWARIHHQALRHVESSRFEILPWSSVVILGERATDRGLLTADCLRDVRLRLSQWRATRSTSHHSPAIMITCARRASSARILRLRALELGSFSGRQRQRQMAPNSTNPTSLEAICTICCPAPGHEVVRNDSGKGPREVPQSLPNNIRTTTLRCTDQVEFGHSPATPRR